jgi:hypothetical protein
MVSTMKALVFVGLLTVGVAVADFDESVSNELKLFVILNSGRGS